MNFNTALSIGVLSKVRFLGFNNMEEKELDDLFLSKGEERRKEQEERSEGGIR